jgi:phosphoglycolate phosphatase
MPSRLTLDSPSISSIPNNKSVMQKNKKILIFDFDGTIADTNKLITTTMQQTLEAMHLPKKSREECSKTIGLPLAECFRALLPLSAEEGQACADTYREIFNVNNCPGAVPPFPGVIDAMRQLHDAGNILTVATSRSHHSVTDFLHDLQIEPLISYVLGADDVVRAKPDPFPVEKTLQHFGCSPNDAWVIGDMTYDILMGKWAGAHTCGVTYGNGTREELQEAGAESVVDTMGELLDALS